MNMPWNVLKPDQKIELVQQVWDPKCSASSLAQIISEHTSSDVNKNSVISLYNRNPEMRKSHPLGGVSRLPYREKTLKPKKPKSVKKLAPTRIYLSEEEQLYNLAGRHILLEQVRTGECHWPVNRAKPGEQHRFCGLPTPYGDSYCEHHQARAGTYRSTRRA